MSMLSGVSRRNLVRTGAAVTRLQGNSTLTLDTGRPDCREVGLESLRRVGVDSVRRHRRKGRATGQEIRGIGTSSLGKDVEALVALATDDRQGYCRANSRTFLRQFGETRLFRRTRLCNVSSSLGWQTSGWRWQEQAGRIIAVASSKLGWRLWGSVSRLPGRVRLGKLKIGPRF